MGGAGYRRVNEKPLERGIGAGIREALEGSVGKSWRKIFLTTTSPSTLVVTIVVVTGISLSLHAVLKK